MTDSTPATAATNLWCDQCRGYGDHLTIRHPPAEPIPGCQGYARVDTLAQADHVMDSSVEEFGGTWHVLGHDGHYHVGEVAP